MLNRSFWHNRKVFVTGHTGFKGSWLCLWLEALGADVTGYALEPPSQPNLFEQARVAEGLRSIRGDVRYLDSRQITADTLNIRALYHTHGFHDMKLAVKTPYDTLRRGVVVQFEIVEGAQYPLRGVAHLGLEVLPPPVRTYVHRDQLYELGEPFDQAESLSALVER